MFEVKQHRSRDTTDIYGTIRTASCPWRNRLFDEAVTLNLVTRHFHLSGTETFVGCVDGSGGTLEWAFQGTGELDLETLAVTAADGVQHLTGSTGELDGARGAIMFSLIGEGPATYEGSVIL